MPHSLALFTTAILLAFVAAVAAADDRRPFERGVEAARAGDYREAVAAFQAALDAGVDTPALHFNLGVALYRLGRLDQSVPFLRRAAQSQAMGGPAAYNLGRIAREGGDEKAAMRWFEQAAERAQTEAVRARALAQLGPQRDGTVRGTLGIGAGYDSNIDLTPADSGVSRESDEFALVEAYLQADWSEQGYLFGAAYGERYRDADDYDLTAIQAGAGWRGAADPWPSHRATLRQTRFGGEAFENAVRWDARMRYDTATGSAGIELGLAGLDGADGYDHLDGHRWRLAAEWEQDVLGGRGSVAYRLTGVERDDFATAGVFYSYSYRRHRIETTYELALADGRDLKLTASGARYRYADLEIRDGDRLGRRRETDLQLSAALEQPLTADWRIVGRATAHERRANLDPYSYERSVFTLRVTRDL